MVVVNESDTWRMREGRWHNKKDNRGVLERERAVVLGVG